MAGKPRIFNFEQKRGYTAPDLVHYHPMSNGDVSILKSLSREFAQSGLVAAPEKKSPVTILEEASEMFSEAIAHAKYEKDLNPEFYHPEVEAMVQARKDVEGDTFENPDLPEATPEEELPEAKDASSEDYEAILARLNNPIPFVD